MHAYALDDMGVLPGSGTLPHDHKAVAVTRCKQLLTGAPFAIDHWRSVPLQAMIHSNPLVVRQIVGT